MGAAHGERAPGNLTTGECGPLRQPTSAAGVWARVASGGRAKLSPPPADFDRLVEWLESVSNGLVLLEEYPMGDLQAMVRRVSEVVRQHGREFDDRLGSEPTGAGNAGTWGLLRADHGWFSMSTAQFDWFLGIVEREDHGGHRQALGQYGRLLVEALRRHRSAETAYFRDRG